MHQVVGFMQYLRAFTKRPRVPFHGVLNVLRRVLLVLCLVGGARTSAAQAAAPRVELSFGVDTTIPVVGRISALVREYLARPDSSAVSKGLWRTDRRGARTIADPAAQAYQGFPATILGVTGVGSDDSLYVVKVLHASADSSGNRVRPLALQRFDAVRDDGAPYGWRLSSPLRRLTRSWRHRSYSRITFWYAPDVRPDSRRAREAAAFVDSISRLFSLTNAPPLDAYLSRTVDGGERLLGLDFFPEGSGPGTGLGGRSLPDAGVLLLGDPAIGEAYRHEFVHAVLGPSLRPRNYLGSEGLAVWLGGSKGKTPRQLYAELAAYQRTNPSVSIYQLVSGEAPGGASATTALYATAGLLADAVYRQSGLPGLTRFIRLEGDPVSVLGNLPMLLGPNATDLTSWWTMQAPLAARR